MTTRYFRAGVGTVIYNHSGQVAIFKRATHPIGVWEFQQGGIDIGESPEVTVWRELAEEIGLVEDDFNKVDRMPGWTIYEQPSFNDDLTYPIMGQGHCWFFLKLKPERVIDLTKATMEEASEFKWTNFDELISLTGEHKRPVYQTLKDYFYTHLSK